ncbi:hypothetical protein [Tautonia plasticadhaerens]|uniref:Uncharacterized protein n=1 Tax=Tautonia plasticadhaerens TaxID=2527974 RepID=A0A518H4I9_9BACT|nr:hypothetical protein [Tautonia plasticadhaerens]QDV35755.1 hypothetical protein ElP_36610 [Tautonia plasticadhaerens]
MHRRRLFALVASGLVLAASGCAGPARRAGMVGASAGGRGMPGLIRPADPIARLSPAPVTVGPSPSLAMRDPGSYTIAARPAGRPGPDIRPSAVGLTVGGGQLADRGVPTAEPPRSPFAPRAVVADRPGSGPGRITDPDPIAGPAAGTPPALAGGVGGSVPRVDSGADPEPIAGLGPAPPGPGESLADGPPSAPSRGPASAPESDLPIGPPPMLAAGIDLETYAAPPVATDPDARLASGRRPIAVLRDVLTGNRQDPAPEEAEPEPEVTIEVPPDPASSPAVEDDPTGVPALDPPPGPEEPARDDVLPAVARPDRAIAEGPASYADPHLAVDLPSPFERDRPGPRLLSRVRQLGKRLIPGRDDPDDRRAGVIGRGHWSLPRLGLLPRPEEAPDAGARGALGRALAEGGRPGADGG